MLNETYINTIKNKKGNIKIAVVYPNSYYLGMSNLGFQSIFNFLSASDFFHANRFFYDEVDQVYSPEDDFLLSQANIILVSQSFENDFLNLIEMLISSGIEPLSKRRKNPFIGVGGAFPTLNPELFLSLADLIFIGEYESYSDNLIQFILSISNQKHIEDKDFYYDKAELFLSRFVYYENAKKDETKTAIVENLLEPNYSHILTPDTSFSNSFLVEITRGCRFRCQFCTVPSLYGALRYFPKEALFDTFDLGLKHTKKIGFVSALTTDHPDLKELIHYVNEREGEVSFSSLRIEQIDDEFLGLIKSNGQNILTIAPEVASLKLKKKIKKPVQLGKIYTLIKKALKLRFKKIKLYFMIGFEEEDEEDLNEIIFLVSEIRKIALSFAKELKYMPEIILSVNQFIPKSGTPLSSDPLLDPKAIKKRFQYLRKKLLPLGNISIKNDNYTENYLQWQLSHANKELGERIILWKKENLSDKAIMLDLKRTGRSFEPGNQFI